MMKLPQAALSRRALVLLGCAAAMPAVTRADANGQPGVQSPRRRAPDLSLTDQAGRQTALRVLLEGKVSVLQLMFTGCSNVCPIQGALFAGLEPSIRSLPATQLLSISIDPLGDSPAELRKWLAKFSAGSSWHAAVPADADLVRLKSWLGGSESDSFDRHTTQIFLVDSTASLCWRSTELPSVGEVLTAVRRLHAVG
jgi:protein SCO1/2